MMGHSAFSYRENPWPWSAAQRAMEGERRYTCPRQITPERKPARRKWWGIPRFHIVRAYDTSLPCGAPWKGKRRYARPRQITPERKIRPAQMVGYSAFSYREGPCLWPVARRAMEGETPRPLSRFSGAHTGKRPSPRLACPSIPFNTRCNSGRKSSRCRP